MRFKQFREAGKKIYLLFTHVISCKALRLAQSDIKQYYELISVKISHCDWTPNLLYYNRKGGGACDL